MLKSVIALGRAEKAAKEKEDKEKEAQGKMFGVELLSPNQKNDNGMVNKDTASPVTPSLGVEQVNFQSIQKGGLALAQKKDDGSRSRELGGEDRDRKADDHGRNRKDLAKPTVNGSRSPSHGPNNEELQSPDFQKVQRANKKDSQSQPKQNKGNSYLKKVPESNGHRQNNEPQDSVHIPRKPPRERSGDRLEGQTLRVPETLSEKKNPTLSPDKQGVIQKAPAQGDVVLLDDKQRQLHSMIMTHLNSQVKELIRSRKQIQKYHGASEKPEQQNSDSSIGSISSADDRDLELILNGDHQHRFQIFQLIKNLIKANNQKKQNKKNFCADLKDCFVKFCKKGKKDDQKKNAGDKNGANGDADGQKAGDKQIGALKKDSKWKLVKKVANEQSTTNLAQNVLRLNREMKMIKQKQDQQKEKDDAMNRQIQMQQNEGETQQLDQSLLGRVKRFFSKQMIEPNSRKLKNFHLVVACALYMDFFLTGFILSNYKFLIGDPALMEFLNHETLYTLITIVQVTDILLTFFKIQIVDVKEIREPLTVALNYLKGSFVLDVIAVVPYSIYNPKYIFLRYLKLLKFSIYQKYFNQFIVEMLHSSIEKQQLNKVNEMFDLIVQLCFVSHFFACVWLLIGFQQLYWHADGWIRNNHEGGIQLLQYWSLYTSSVYWVIASFTSVGYGDIKGHTTVEYLYQILVEMIGIGFYGYMIGTFQNLFRDIQTKDHFNDQQQQIDHWLISLDKARKNQHLPYLILEGVRSFHSMKFRYDAMKIQHTEIFKILKPRLKIQVLDQIFNDYYKIFEFVFEDCDNEFKREIILNSEFLFYQNENKDDKEEQETNNDLNSNELPVIEQADEKSKHVYFLISGQIHIMNKEGLYEYGILPDGSYFGEISVLFDQPNEYSYFYNPNADKPIQMLTVEADLFIQICKKHPLSMETLIKRAKKRQQIFQNFKCVTLLKYMKTLKKNPKIVTQHEEHTSIHERVQQMKEADIKFNLIKTMILNYQMNRQYRVKLQNELAEEEAQQKKKQQEESSKPQKKNSFGPSDEKKSYDQSPKDKAQNFKNQLTQIQKKYGSSVKVKDTAKSKYNSNKFEGGVHDAHETNKKKNYGLMASLDQVESEEELSSEFQNSNFMSKDSALMMSSSDDNKEEKNNIDYSISSESCSSQDPLECDQVPDLKGLNSFELRILIKRNRIDFREKLKDYFLQRKIQAKNKDKSDFYEEQCAYTGVTIRKRKPASHIDLVIEEYLNLRQIEKEQDLENKLQLQRHLFQEPDQMEKDKDEGDQGNKISELDAKMKMCDEFTQGDSELKDARKIQGDQNKLFQAVRSEQLLEIRKDLDSFMGHFNRNLQKIKDLNAELCK